MKTVGSAESLVPNFIVVIDDLISKNVFRQSEAKLEEKPAKMEFSLEKLTKYTGYYRCPDDIKNFKVRIKYVQVPAGDPDPDPEKDEDDDDEAPKPPDEVKFEWQSKVIGWQQKHFSKSESDFYSDPLNCVSDLEKSFHEQLKEQGEGTGEVYTYVQGEGYSDEEFASKMTRLQYLVENTDEAKDLLQVEDDDFDFTKHLQSSIRNNIIPTHVEKMYIIADLGESIEDIWIKDERLLHTLKYEANTQVLSVYPDFTTVEPYFIKLTHSDGIKYFLYFLENYSEASDEYNRQEREVLQKVTEYARDVKKRVIGNKFPLPPKNKLYVYLFLEILSARNFEYPDVYVRYYIDLPDGWCCERPETLQGRTRTCHAVNDENLLHFGHCSETVLQYNLQNLSETGVPKTPYIYFEVFSQGSWGRYRTEGLAYRNLPVSQPGRHSYNLSCFRFTQGKSAAIDKMVVDTVGTGELKVRMNVVHQSQAFLKEFSEGERTDRFIYEKLNSSSLIKSVDEVLHAFRRARRNMLEVRKDL
ncbi:hypothetical protein NQ315_002254 [Exocentrus adspersus]|uniref:Uncharacterized protein n=1 Tax=Exocentrus adspersus TaxID=1586481 RepID=A0AAV8VSE6_9CUCU|nr:hypothetical protein NQ315_002254 [Exocentrus adspersus]